MIELIADTPDGRQIKLVMDEQQGHKFSDNIVIINGTAYLLDTLRVVSVLYSGDPVESLIDDLSKASKK